MKFLALFISLVISTGYCLSQSSSSDFNKVWVDTSFTDEEKLNKMYDIVWELIGVDPDSTIVYADVLYQRAQIKGMPKFMAYALSTKAEANVVKGDYQNAIRIHKQAKSIYKSINDQQGISATLSNLGNLFFHLEEYDNALKFLNQALEIDKRNNDTIGMVYILSNIAVSHKMTDNFSQALELYERCLDLISDKSKNEDKHLIATIYGNIGNLHVETGNLEKGYPFLMKSLEMYKQIGPGEGLINGYINLGNYYSEKKQYINALQHLNKALELANDASAVLETRNASFSLYEIHKTLGNNSKALSMYELYIKNKEKILNEENQNEITRIEIENEYNIKAAADSVRIEKEKEVLQAERKRMDQLQYAMFGGGTLVLVFTFFIYTRYRVISKQKKIIEAQKRDVETQRDFAKTKHLEAEQQRSLLEIKNKEIIDSINYAKRLQTAILPSLKEIEGTFSDSFVYYLPKDIVAGDFYWFEAHNGTNFIAAADCTGHGVPGAMVSVLCSNALSTALLEDKIYEPGRILDRTRELIIERFKKSDEAVNDGMDISLASFTKSSNHKTKDYSFKLNWSGANNALWIIRKGTGVIKEIKAAFSTDTSVEFIDGFTFIKVKLTCPEIGLHKKV
ncbi:MAG: tetratricopeptide repeat protein [Brumimicrobium sp.]